MARSGACDVVVSATVAPQRPWGSSVTVAPRAESFFSLPLGPMRWVAGAEFFTFWPFFRKFLSNRPLAERIPEMDPWLGARVSGAELGATVSGVELLATGKRPARGSAPERMAPSSAP